MKSFSPQTIHSQSSSRSTGTTGVLLVFFVGPVFGKGRTVSGLKVVSEGGVDL